jgi:hypothetical protein
MPYALWLLEVACLYLEATIARFVSGTSSQVIANGYWSVTLKKVKHHSHNLIVTLH